VKTAWCTLEAIKDSPTFQIAAEALMRAHGMTGKSPFSGFKVGVWDAPKPIVSCRGSRAYEKAVADPKASEKWYAFLQEKREHAEALRIAFSKCEVTTCFAEVVRSAADYEGELPIPTQGFPDFSTDAVAKALYPEPPAPLLLEWLVKAPAQRVPPG
jgi:hypothetical protein